MPNYGPKIVTDGLVLCLDAHDAKSYAGEPTTNFFYRETPRIDSSYSTYVYNSDSTWGSNHPNAIRVYNTDGTEISSYVNTGANSGNWQVIGHAHWVYDSDLRKPVVKMHSVSGYEGQWRALSRNLGHNLSQLGLTAGDKFTISWLQKADVEGVYARAGIYMRNTGGSNGFHAGQAASSDVGQLSSELGKWAHKSKTFTVPSGMNETGYNVGLYMYGHYSPTHQNTIYISDVQVETGDYATPIVQGVSSSNSGYWGARTYNTSWKDRVSGNYAAFYNEALTRKTHYRDGQVIMPVSASHVDFDGSNDMVTFYNNTGLFRYTPSGSTYNNNITIEVWFRINNNDGGNIISYPWNGSGEYNWRLMENYVIFSGAGNVSISGVNDGNWHQLVGIATPTTIKAYIDGSLSATTNHTSTYTGPTHGVTQHSFAIMTLYPYGTWAAGNTGFSTDGQFAIARIYNKELTAAEISLNYNVSKGRFS
jgi:hypothetical protein